MVTVPLRRYQRNSYNNKIKCTAKKKKKGTWFFVDAKVEEESLDEEEDVRHVQADQRDAHLDAETKNLIGELGVYGPF